MGGPLGQTMGHRPSKGNPRLRLERLARRWEQDDVAAGLDELAALLGEAVPGVDANLVSKWERGLRVPTGGYARLAEAFLQRCARDRAARTEAADDKPLTLRHEHSLRPKLR